MKIRDFFKKFLAKKLQNFGWNSPVFASTLMEFCQDFTIFFANSSKLLKSSEIGGNHWIQSEICENSWTSWQKMLASFHGYHHPVGVDFRNKIRSGSGRRRSSGRVSSMQRSTTPPSSRRRSRRAAAGRAQLLTKSAHAGHLRLPAELLEVGEVGEKLGKLKFWWNSGEISVKFRQNVAKFWQNQQKSAKCRQILSKF